MVVFNASFNTFARKYLVSGNGEDEAFLEKTFQSQYYECLSDVLEQLLLFDKVSIKVYGENIVLAVLIDALGTKQVLDLVDSGAIEFLLWTPGLFTTTNDDLMGKIMPIQSGNLNTSVHTDPVESISTGLKWSRKIKKNDAKKLIAKVANVYQVPDKQFPHDAAKLVMSAYSTNKLDDLGLKCEKDITLLNYEERSKLLSLGSSVLETAILSNYDYSSFGNYSYYTVSKKSFDNIRRATGVYNGFEDVIKTESLPNIRQLLFAGKISPTDILKLRQNKVSIEFRKWLEDNTRGDSLPIVKQYIEDITNHKGILEHGAGKFIKTITMYGVGAAVGGAVAGIHGVAAGVSLSKLLEPASDLGLSFIDAYLLDGLLKGWHPKMFIDKYENITNDKK